MHDHIRDLGRAIVAREDAENPCNRSIIWSNIDAVNLLKDGKGSDVVEMMKVDLGDEYKLTNKDFNKIEKTKEPLTSSSKEPKFLSVKEPLNLCDDRKQKNPQASLTEGHQIQTNSGVTLTEQPSGKLSYAVDAKNWTISNDLLHIKSRGFRPGINHRRIDQTCKGLPEEISLIESPHYCYDMPVQSEGITRPCTLEPIKKRTDGTGRSFADFRRGISPALAARRMESPPMTSALRVTTVQEENRVFMGPTSDQPGFTVYSLAAPATQPGSAPPGFESRGPVPQALSQRSPTYSDLFPGEGPSRFQGGRHSPIVPMDLTKSLEALAVSADGPEEYDGPSEPSDISLNSVDSLGPSLDLNL
ncbi:hypothetical protein LINPERHAP2_LOCUS5124, partial [Linum perenne]